MRSKRKRGRQTSSSRIQNGQQEKLLHAKRLSKHKALRMKHASAGRYPKTKKSRSFGDPEFSKV
jgi:hypothetical protein